MEALTNGGAHSFRNEPRRRFSVQYKRELVEAVLASPMSLARVAREHGLNQNQLARWRREYEQGKYHATPVRDAALVPVSVEATPALPPSVVDAAGTGSADGERLR